MDLDAWLFARKDQTRKNPPLVSLCYAQSLNGSIGIINQADVREPLALSGDESLALTHQLRAAHDAILVGIGTILADNPSLTVRFAAGVSPQPVILDSHLKIPLGVMVIAAHPKRPWVATTSSANTHRMQELEDLGIMVWVLPEDETGRVSLPALLEKLRDHGIGSLMVEGGARVLTAFMEQRLADRLCVTVTPRLVAGINVIEGLAPGAILPDLDEVVYERYGDDLVVFARIYS